MKSIIFSMAILLLSSCLLSEDKVTEQQLMSTQKQYVDTVKVRDYVSDTTYQVITKHLSDSTTVYDTIKVVKTMMVVDTIKHVIDSTIYLKDTVRTIRFDTLTKSTVVKLDTIRQTTMRYDTVKMVTIKLDTVKQVLIKYDTVNVVTTRLDTIKQTTVKLDTIHFVSSDTIHTVIRDTVTAGLPVFGVLNYGGSILTWRQAGALKYMYVSGTLAHATNKDIFVTVTPGLYSMGQLVGRSPLGDETCSPAISNATRGLCEESVSFPNYSGSINDETSGTITIKYPMGTVLGQHSTLRPRVLTRMCPVGYRFINDLDRAYLSAYARSVSDITWAAPYSAYSNTNVLDTLTLTNKPSNYYEYTVTGINRTYNAQSYDFSSTSPRSIYQDASQSYYPRECVSGTIPTN